METLNDVLAKQSSFDILWDLLKPIPAYNNRKDICRDYWNTLSLAKQRQIYGQLREDIRHGVKIVDNPYYAIYNCTPYPTNWNGKNMINRLMNENKMVSAKYDGAFGIYTLAEANVWNMTDIKPLNY